MRSHIFLLLLGVLVLNGCASTARPLMPTPALYLGPQAKAVFTEVPAAHQSTDIELLYLTNRMPQNDPENPLPYGAARSRSVAFGAVRVAMGPGLDWGDLVLKSHASERKPPVTLTLAQTTELGRYPGSPYALTRTAAGFARDPGVVAQHKAATAQLQQEITRRLADLPKKEVIFYVHGFNETFATAAFTLSELCHFFGRENLCVFFTWPAGSGGNLLFAYGQDRESGEFSVGHLKRAIRTVARTPAVEKIHLLAHSRGSDILLQAIRELLIEGYAVGQRLRDAFKIHHVALMAPDIDIDVAGQRIAVIDSDPELLNVWQYDQLPRFLSGRLTMYTSASDRALLASAILFRSRRRLGRVRAEDLGPQAFERLQTSDLIHLIEAPAQRVDFLGHSYFANSPDVSSDLIALIRYDLKPGEPGRPLRSIKPPLVWAIQPGTIATDTYKTPRSQAYYQR